MLVQQDQDFPLLEAAISLGQEVQPDLDIQGVLHDIDVLAARLHSAIPRDAGGLQRLYLLNEFFYEKLGFAANANDFADPGNSYLHRLLQTRRGIPISMALLWLELAREAGLNAYGISFPGHFLVKIRVDEGLIVQDPINGRGLTLPSLEERLEPFRERWGVEAEEMAPISMFLQPASGREIVERMLRNLQACYEALDNSQALLGVLNRLLVLRPEDWSAYRDRGLLQARLGRRQQAIQDLQLYAGHVTGAHDLGLIQARLEQLRAQI